VFAKSYAKDALLRILTEYFRRTATVIPSSYIICLIMQRCCQDDYAMLLRLCASLLLVATAAGCSSQLSTSVEHVPSTIPYTSSRTLSAPHVTLASWYGPGFDGRSTSTGEVFDSRRYTAASRALPLGSYARVTNLDNGQSVVVRINDRGPFVHGRGIDLSQAAAERLGFRHDGLARVEVTRLDATASAIPVEPQRWKGTAQVRRYYHWRRSHHDHSRHLVRNPFMSWLLEVTR
jgi:Lytic transglycolase